MWKHGYIRGDFYFCVVHVTGLQRVGTLVALRHEDKGVVFDSLHIHVYGLNQGEPRFTHRT